MRVTERVQGFCPRHSPQNRLCSEWCLPERVDFARAANALRNYWRDRRRGARPESLAEYRVRYGLELCALQWTVRKDDAA